MSALLTAFPAFKAKNLKTDSKQDPKEALKPEKSVTKSLQDLVNIERNGHAPGFETILRKIIALLGITRIDHILSARKIYPNPRPGVNNNLPPLIPNYLVPYHILNARRAKPAHWELAAEKQERQAKERQAKAALQQLIMQAAQGSDSKTTVEVRDLMDALGMTHMDLENERIGLDPNVEAALRQVLEMNGINLSTLFPQMALKPDEVKKLKPF